RGGSYHLSRGALAGAAQPGGNLAIQMGHVEPDDRRIDRALCASESGGALGARSGQAVGVDILASGGAAALRAVGVGNQNREGPQSRASNAGGHRLLRRIHHGAATRSVQVDPIRAQRRTAPRSPALLVMALFWAMATA